MDINKCVYNEIISTAKLLPPETGGLLGGRNNTVVEVLRDEGIHSDKKCSYYPNTALFNRTIKEWRSKDIDFMGIYHTHYWGVDTLSEGDKIYITRIMRNMPEGVNQLYFPVLVMPDKKLVCYKKKKNLENLVIETEPVEIK